MDLNIIYIILGVVFLVGIILFFILKKKGLRVISGTFAVISIILFCIFSFNPLLDRINYGIDLQGGFEILYDVSALDENEKLDSEMLYNTYKALLKRIDNF